MRFLNTFTLLCLLPFALNAFGQTDYPKQVIRMIVPFSAGGVGDSVARPLAKELAVKLKQPVIVENKPGAGSTLGTAVVARAPADGYTLLVASDAGLVLAPNVQQNLPFDPQRDFVSIGLLSMGGQFLVVPSNSPFHSLKDLVAEAKRRPGGIPYASLGVGSMAHLSMETLSKRLDIPVIHVPYQGVAPAIVDVSGGQVDTMFAGGAAAIPLIKSGRLRAIGFTGDIRSPILPDVPTFGELGVRDFVLQGWFGVFAPAATPPAVIAKLREAVQKIVQMPSFQKDVILASGGELPLQMSAAEWSGFMASEVARAQKLVEPIRSQLK